VRRVETLVDSWPALLWVLAEVRTSREPVGHLYQIPLGVADVVPDEVPDVAYLGEFFGPGGTVHIYDALVDPVLASAFCTHVEPGLEFTTIRPESGEQSNTSLVLDERYILKVFRRITRGPNPDVEVTEALGRAGFGGVPVPLEVWRRGDTDLAVLRRYERARGDGVSLTMDSLREVLNRRRPPRDCRLDFAEEARCLGRDVAELHVALAETFGVEPADGAAWALDMSAQAGRVAAGVLDTARIEAVYRRLRSADDLGSAIRIHGDLHLGQVLRLGDRWMVLDFEGEPARPVEERRRPSSPLKDVAGMTRSFHYAAGLALREWPVPDDEVRVLAEAWAVRSVNSFLSGYASFDEAHRLLPATRSARDGLLSMFELDKAVYEVAYELSHRPDLVDLPIRAVEELLGEDDQSAPGDRE
jgi:maltokinase